MVNLTWNNRLILLLVALSIVFIVLIGWIIFRENRLTTSTIENQLYTHSSTTSTSPTSSASIPTPAQSSETTQQMYARMQRPAPLTQAAPDNASGYNTVNTTDQYYNAGYAWASGQNISEAGQCQMLSTEYINGCQAYVEVKHYVDQTDPNRN